MSLVVRTLPAWQDVLKKLWASRDAEGVHTIGFDTETLDRNWPGIKIVGFSVAWYVRDPAFGIMSKERAYVPVGHNTGELQLAMSDVIPGIKAILEDDGIEITGQNLKYDLKVMRLYGVQMTENIFDTLIMSWLLNTNGVGSKLQVLMGEGEHGLKALSLHLLGKKMTELTDLAPKEKYVREGVEFETLRVDLVPIEDQFDADGKMVKQGIANYAGDDAENVLDLRERFKKELDADPKTLRVYHAIQREFIFVLADMEMFGVELDADFLREMRGRVDAEILQVKEKMYSTRKGQDFDPVRDIDLVTKFVAQWDAYDAAFALPRDHPGYPKKAVTKGPRNAKVTTMEPASKGTLRKKLIEAFDLVGHPLVEKVRDDKLRPEVKLYPHLAHKVFLQGSVEMLNRIFFEEEGLAPIGERGANGYFSTKKDHVEVWSNYGNEMAASLHRYRVIEKLRGTYLVGMVARVAADFRLRGRMNQGGARTGRLSMSDPNLQNQPNNKEFPIRQSFVATGLTVSKVEIHDWYLDEKGKKTKPRHLTVQSLPLDHPRMIAFKAATGYDIEGGYEILEKRVVRWWGRRPPMVLSVGDYSQLEICLLAHESGDEKMVKAVTEGQDIHALTAQAVFDEIPKHYTLEQVKDTFPDLRKKAKPINFGILYGMGPQKLAGTLGISVEDAKDIIENRYMNFYVGVARWITKMHTFVVANGFVKTAVGRKRHLPAAQLPEGRGRQTFGMDNNALISMAKRQAQNTPIQGLAADLVALAMRDIRRRFKSLVITDLEDTMVLRGENGEFPTPQPTGLSAVPFWGSSPEELWGNFTRSLLQVHDELVQESHPAVANWALDEAVGMMEEAGGMKLRVPIRVDAAVGTDWYLTKE